MSLSFPLLNFQGCLNSFENRFQKELVKKTYWATKWMSLIASILYTISFATSVLGGKRYTVTQIVMAQILDWTPFLVFIPVWTPLKRFTLPYFLVIGGLQALCVGVLIWLEGRVMRDPVMSGVLLILLWLSGSRVQCWLSAFFSIIVIFGCLPYLIFVEGFAPLAVAVAASFCAVCIFSSYDWERSQRKTFSLINSLET